MRVLPVYKLQVYFLLVMQLRAETIYCPGLFGWNFRFKVDHYVFGIVMIRFAGAGSSFLEIRSWTVCLTSF